MVETSLDFGGLGLEKSLLKFLIFFIKNFGQKRPIVDKCKKNLLIILNMSIVIGPCIF
jgi:hypothetical protein